MLPSGPRLAAAVAAEVPRDSSDPVIELGAGTGPITAALLRTGVAPSRLFVVERDPLLFTFLAERHPGLTTIQGDATDLPRLLRPLGVTRACAVVSSLPIVFFRAPVRRSLMRYSFALLGSRGPFIQVTNRLGSPLPHDSLGLEGRRAALIWSNLPPASVWIYRRTGAPRIEPLRETAYTGATR